MATALVRRSRGLAGDTVLLCSWARHFTLTVPLSTQEHKWVPVNCWGNLKNCGGGSCDGLPSHSGELAEILLAASCYRNRYKLRRLWVSRLQGFKILRMLNKISCYSSPGSAVPSFKARWLVIIIFTVVVVSSFSVTALRIIFVGPISQVFQALLLISA